ncbi:hypothetical protein D3C72_1397880 [compost metagenome]
MVNRVVLGKATFEIRPDARLHLVTRTTDVSAPVNILGSGPGGCDIARLGLKQAEDVELIGSRGS